jgi:diguanylate cyclase (GGDEF)-like protein
MSSGPAAPEPVPPEVAERIVRALDRSPATVAMLIDADLRVRWISHSATWVTGTDPSRRTGADSLDRVHPEDVERLVHGLDVLRAARPAPPDDAAGADTSAVAGPSSTPVTAPVRYRFQRYDGQWVVLEAVIHNLLDDPVVRGMLVESRLVEDGLDGVGHVVDLLSADAPLPDVLAACAGLVPIYLGSSAVVAVLDGGSVVGAPAGSPASRLATDDRWWRAAVRDGVARTPSSLSAAGAPADLADPAAAEGFRTVWTFPLTDDSTASAAVIGCLVVWVQIDVEFNLAIADGLRQTRRLASMVIGEARRRHALRRLAVTDPLTGLANRSALRRRLDEATQPVTLALVDLDDFKPVNDTYGHDTGDGVLRVVAGRLADSVRADDLVVRFGGDEFAVVFADDTPPESATGLAQRLVRAIEQPITLPGGPTITVGASVGLATAPAEKVVRLADTSLYEAKRAKQNGGAAEAPPL